MNCPHSADVAWFKSSYSSGDQSCVETAVIPGRVPVRDSKTPHGPVLTFTSAAWTRFVNDVVAHSI
jgi:hypothetical protein